MKDLKERLNLLSEIIEDLAYVSDMENRGPMYAGLHIRSGMVMIDAECSEALKQGAKDIKTLLELVQEFANINELLRE